MHEQIVHPVSKQKANREYSYVVVKQTYTCYSSTQNKDLGKYDNIEEAFDNKPKDVMTAFIQVYYIVEARCLSK